jgi:hypothetical protein
LLSNCKSLVSLLYPLLLFFFSIRRLLSILSSSIGNPANGTAAALHKCLTCDKPLNPFGVDVDGFTNPMFHYSPSPAQDEVLPAGRALLTQGRPLSSSSMPILPPVSSGQGGGVSFIIIIGSAPTDIFF